MKSPSIGELVFLANGRAPAAIAMPAQLGGRKAPYNSIVPIYGQEEQTTIKEPQAIPEEVWQELLSRQPDFPGVAGAQASRQTLGDLYEGIASMPVETDFSPAAGFLKGIYGVDVGYKAPESGPERAATLVGLQKLMAESADSETEKALGIIRSAMQERSQTEGKSVKEAPTGGPPAPRVDQQAKLTDETIKDYTDRIAKLNAPALVSAFKQLESRLPTPGEEKFTERVESEFNREAGVKGAFKNPKNAALAAAARAGLVEAPIREAFQSFRNQIAKLRAGAAQTDSEMLRIEKELADGTLKTYGQFQDAMRRISDAIRADISNAEVLISKSPQLRAEYERRAMETSGGPILSKDPVFNSRKLMPMSIEGGVPVADDGGYSIGKVKDGYRYKGGGFKDPKNWEPVK